MFENVRFCLYDRNEAKLAREKKPVINAELAEARKKARLIHCPGCQQDVDWKRFDRKLGLCWTCRRKKPKTS